MQIHLDLIENFRCIWQRICVNISYADFRNYINIICKLENLRDQQGELLHDLDDILYDLGSFKRRQENLTAQKVNYENTLKELGHEEIEREIDNCIRRYREVDRLIPEKATLWGKLNTDNSISNVSLSGSRLKQMNSFS